VKYTSREPGSTSGMLVGLYVNQDDYLYANSPSAGFRVSLSSSSSYFICRENNVKTRLYTENGGYQRSEMAHRAGYPL